MKKLSTNFNLKQIKMNLQLNNSNYKFKIFMMEFILLMKNYKSCNKININHGKIYRTILIKNSEIMRKNKIKN